ncbi:hypothetical protein MY11210_009463, partial [Beauveria gryllotalpidicola]
MQAKIDKQANAIKVKTCKIKDDALDNLGSRNEAVAYSIDKTSPPKPTSILKTTPPVFPNTAQGSPKTKVILETSFTKDESMADPKAKKTKSVFDVEDDAIDT